MHVAELGRFPVKSMAGEPLGRAGPSKFSAWLLHETA